jgi:hypothetical protein
MGRILAVGDGFELVVTGYAMPRSPRGASSLLKRARADDRLQGHLQRLLA